MLTLSVMHVMSCVNNCVKQTLSFGVDYTVQ